MSGLSAKREAPQAVQPAKNSREICPIFLRTKGVHL
nr:MAG TPA: hypothetical protein [Caudoviricetes sp.]